MNIESFKTDFQWFSIYCVIYTIRSLFYFCHYRNVIASIEESISNHYCTNSRLKILHHLKYLLCSSLRKKGYFNRLLMTFWKSLLPLRQHSFRKFSKIFTFMKTESLKISLFYSFYFDNKDWIFQMKTTKSVQIRKIWLKLFFRNKISVAKWKTGIYQINEIQQLATTIKCEQLSQVFQNSL